ncbi:S1C family serine protease [Pseudoflavonifractor sp. MSJ-37]|uniref:S1C family serine protease n=1 Tax=Pseudoflavonifractor sp. MSJ-37 TaxID=2841531 RepID=UPI001C10FC89|nr:trypsin-like peptidase domain-containing protein [Pseudoflavonifractor sp. MSJ-37]MBU5435279.1 trypsin-like peptidase domain-containing protein [Pseudoflavonifractor sp. MSJ-37]
MFDRNDENFDPNDPRRGDRVIETDDFQVHGDPWENRTSGRKPPMKRRGGMAGRLVALGLCCALIGGAVGGGTAWYVSQDRGDTVLYEGESRSVNVDTTSVKSGQAMTAAQLYAANVDACVGITTQVNTNVYGYVVQGAAAGSGFVISSDGYIVTNYHVIKDATSIKVAFHNGQSYDAKLVGGEAENDIAVLKIEATGLHALTLGDSDSLVVGEPVYTIGNPLGELTWSLTDGLVSAKDRSVTTSEGQTINMIQTNAAINSGNSGGPLFNAYGEVIGITSAKASNSGSSSSAATIEGLGFAIPINDVKSMITDIIEHGYVTGKPNVGVLLSDVPSYATQYGVPAGASVEAVLSGSCADKAGIQQGDIICAIDGTDVDSTTALKDAVRQKKAGDTVTLTIYRDGEKKDVSVTLDEDNQTRQNALSDLQTTLSEQKKQASQQQQQSSGGNGYSGWPFFGFGY